MEKQKSNISPHNVLIYPLHSTSGAEIAGGKGNMRKNTLKLIAGVLLLANIVILAGSVQSEPRQTQSCRDVQISTEATICQ